MTDPTTVPCNAAQLHRFGDLQSAHGPHEWIVQPGMDPVRCPGAGEPPAAPAVQAPAADRAAIRDRIAAVLRPHASLGGTPPRWELPFFDGATPSLPRIAGWKPLDDVADAIAAVLPAPAVRAAVLREAAEVADGKARRLPGEWGGHDWGQRAAGGARAVAAELRRLADEAGAWCKCRSCWGWFVEAHPGEDLDELGKDLSWWSGLPVHRDAPDEAQQDGVRS